ncbi:MAG: hypothetical protein U0230_16375 [Polyangiales bacterium]
MSLSSRFRVTNPRLLSRVLRTTVLACACAASLASNGSDATWALYEVLPLANAPMTGTLSGTTTSFNQHFKVDGTGTDTHSLILRYGVVATTTSGGAVPLTVTVTPKNGQAKTSPLESSTEGSWTEIEIELPCSTAPCQIDATTSVAVASGASLGSSQVRIDWSATGILEGNGASAPVETKVDVKLVTP